MDDARPLQHILYRGHASYRLTGQSTASGERLAVNSADATPDETQRRTNASPWPAAARSPAAWRRRRRITGRCCCWPARRARPSARARPSRRRSRACGAEVDPEHVQIVTDPQELAGGDVRRRGGRRGSRRQGGPAGRAERDRSTQRAILASTTSSLSIERLAQASGRPERFVGLHVFNPVTKMKLVELVFPRAASEETRERALALCETFEKTPVEVPDVPGFVVNRLLFPYLFSAVRLLEETGMDAGGDRHLHAPRRRAPDGAARAARPRRPRRRQGDRRDDRRDDPAAHASS